ncbi:RNA-binding domain-containing protein [Aureobasidium pullulans]|uniref:RNA-binding domain-containing protein n=1 Tax=Aureobasidium pullulans TaxID=5580 RepID=A0A4S9FDG1_AURPU|nr:RNA-binding domain-containing protein [Aureobasidium pullulans]THW50849.1 RNA-binding domain-containing protein [Aureobasidium pullulans]THW54310.1 RNA-binding domain-containing protein [Aureobasidium pullulans]THW60583.1 RNA-binding domain-containing protein [Aureobasidium pullulans]THW64333.1 RNA-binding domain-containing protein [Aureobasidium pullulans]
MRITDSQRTSRETKVRSAIELPTFTPACHPPMLPSPTPRHRSVRQLPLRQLTDPTQRDRSRSRRRSRSPRRSRRSYDSRSRSRSRDNYRRDERRSRSPVNGSTAAPGYAPSNTYPSDREGGAAAPAPRNFEERVVAKEQMMQNVREHSQQDRRVYVGNLSYDVKWHHLKDFMRQAGEVIFADVLLLPNGMSKGCGIVEYATRDQAQNAVNSLSNQNLMGRLVYVREDREAEPRFSSGGQGGGGGMRGGFQGGPMRGGFNGGFDPMGGGGGPGMMAGGSRQIYVSNLPYTVGWQDLKDLFRQAAHTGNVIRADVHVTPDGRMKGSGIVAFDNPDDAQVAIQQFNGYDWNGRVLEVREDRFAGPPGFGGGRGGFMGGRGGFGGQQFGGRGGFMGGRGGFGGQFGGRGGFAGQQFGGPPGGFHGGPPAAPAPPNPFTDFATSGGEPGPVIYVRNLPWSTSNEDLVELFTTIGKVERAEIQYEPNGRSRGTGVVEFGSVDDAATAITKFSGYQYGGRPLGLTYVRYSNQQPAMDPMQGQEQTSMPMGLTQDQIM